MLTRSQETTKQKQEAKKPKKPRSQATKAKKQKAVRTSQAGKHLEVLQIKLYTLIKGACWCILICML